MSLGFSLSLGAFLGAGCAAEAQTDDALIAMPGPTFPLKRSAGKSYLEDAGGKPFFMNGDTAWGLVAGVTREDADFYLRDRAARGVNTVMSYVLCQYHAKNAPANAYGAMPFAPMLDFTRPNEAYFAQMDWVVARAKELGILLILSPAWLGAKGTMGGFYQEMRAAGPDAMRTYGRYLGNRYREATNIMWLLGGDFNPPEKPLVRRMAEGIREGGSTGLQTVHCNAYWSPVEVWEGETWLDVNNVYTYGSVWDGALKEYARPQRLPYFLAESFYENEQIVEHPEKRIRRQAYEAVLGGAFGHVFGCSPVWHFDGPGPGGRVARNWRDSLNSPGARGMKVLRDLFAGIAWWKLEPDVNGRLLQNPGEGDERAVAAIGRERGLAICYLPTAQPVRVRTSYFADARRLRADWLDPVAGRMQAALPGPGAGDVAIFTPPARNGSNTDDWVLVLRSPG